ncbi:TonB-dependent receptor plug domain-containing protein [Sulfuricella denitrificans]|uniref:TonB-dependent receptor plug domain-containing protein n=1 Tax=Sulfuricella denitrificans TaxID=649841 RepID=UPI0002F3B8E0|nr:TonB-dependent receptor [Sulfuricella denitrificans]
MCISFFSSHFSPGHGLLGSALLLSASMASAGEYGVFSEDAFLDEMPVVLSVSRLPQRVDEAPAAVTVIDRDMIRDSGAWDLSEVMRLVPGMYVAYHASNVYTTNSMVSYHGLSDAYAHRMQVLVDGRSVYSPLFGGVLWADIPIVLDDIERIEVIRGPNSASYGANSFLGVINIISRHPAEQQGTFVSVSSGRSRDEVVARYGGRSDDLTYRLTASQRNDKGENVRIDNPLSNSNVWALNKFDDKLIKMLNFRADYHLSAVDQFEFQFGFNGGSRQEGWSVDSFYPRNKSVENHFEQLRWRRSLDLGNELSVQFYHSQESTADTLYPTASGYQGLSFNADVVAHRYDLEVQHTFSPSDHTRLVWGGSVRLDQTYWPLYLNRQDSFDFHLARLFGNLEWRVKPEVLVNVGAMAENNDFTGTDVTPRMAVNWHFAAGHTLRASHSKATRTPTLYEAEADNRYRVPTGVPAFPQADLIFRSATNGLRPERIASTELGYIGHLASLNVDFRLFHDELTDLISPYKYNPCNPTGTLPNLGGYVVPPFVPAGLTVPGIACYGVSSTASHNAGSAVVKGFETQLQWQLGQRTKLIYGLSHTRIASPNEDGQAYTNSAPTNSQSLMLTHRFNDRWSGSLMGYQVGEVRMVGADSGPDKLSYFVDTYRRWDGRVAYRFKAGTGNGELALVVQNLADSNYFEYRHDNQPPGRSAWLNLKLDL